ncbi:MAG: SUMF1/EgtB/PvdO family nonheme iron enzyme [Bdellovibrionota bacterium]|mgnify:CR=1 FL=1
MLFLFVFFMQTARADSCPPDMLDFGHFCMDRFEAPNQEGIKPFVAQTATDGEEWCRSKSKRLCKENEWLWACEGVEKRKYPYGPNYLPGGCNDQKIWRSPNWSLIQQYPGQAGTREVVRLDQAEHAGAFFECTTPEGVYDLGGNVSEWVERTEPHTSQFKHVMMGCYWSGCYAGHRGKEFSICRGANAGHPGIRGEFRTYEAGFRCCRG